MANLKTVAEKVGVSVSTVSNAYNKPDQLSSDLRTRIFDAAAELGYAGPDAAARTLRSGKSWTVGVVLTKKLSYAFSDPYAVTYLAGLTTACEAKGYGVLLIPAIEEGAQISALERASVDAVASFCLSRGDAALAVAKSRNVPIVYEDADLGPNTSWVSIDEQAAGRSLGKHLERLGHRDVVVVTNLRGGDQQSCQWADGGEITQLNDFGRYRGLTESMPGATIRVFNSAPNNSDAGRLAGELILDRHDRPTAIVCLSDVQALGVLEAMNVRGLQAGKDISLTGFDDIPAAAAAGLTTVRQPAFERGRLTGELLIDQERPNRQILLETELIVRSSTGPAPKLS